MLDLLHLIVCIASEGEDVSNIRHQLIEWTEEVEDCRVLEHSEGEDRLVDMM
jgi:hypothetical protein